MKLWYSILDEKNYNGNEPAFFNIDDNVSWKKN